jgi:hypothetical protein
MDSRTSWCLWLLAQQPKPPPADNLFAQEDEETRRMIAHYLHLADLFLSAETTEDQDDDQNTAA